MNFTLGILKMEKEKDTENKSMKMEINTKENGKMIRDMARESFLCRTETLSKETLLTILKRENLHTRLKMER
jgi:hypothetical protein